MPEAPPPAGTTESVWNYPRPPVVRPDARLAIVRWGTVEIARSTRSLTVLETSHPPTWYLPADDVRIDLLVPRGPTSVCEWKGTATSWDLRDGDEVATGAAWSYPEPTPAFAAIAEHFAFHPRVLDCSVDGIGVVAQPGSFYGGWITPELRGPFKGEPGTSHW